MARLSKHSKNFHGMMGRVNRSMHMCLIMVFVFIGHGSGLNVTFTIDGEYITSEEESVPSAYPSIKIFPKALFGALKWKLTNKDLYMARCNVEEDCDAGIRMICVSGKCICKTGDLFFEWPKYGCFAKAHMFGPCEVSGQCVAMHPNTYCNPDTGRCTCSPNYFYNGRECSIRYDGNNMKAQEVYKAAVVAAACFIVAVVGIFVACIVRRSFCRRDQHLQQNVSNQGGDIFSISDEIAALRAVDKPPSYEEVLQIERTFYGIPPPEYSASRSALAPFHPPTNYPTAPPSDLNATHNYLPPSLPHNSATTSRKSSNLESVPVPEYSPVAPVPDNTVINFLATAEVLSPPLDSETQPSSVPSSDVLQASTNSPTSNVLQTFSLSSEPSHSTYPHFISSTPPPRTHKPHDTACSFSSSLPSSPNLGSRFKVLNLPNPFKKELLKDSAQNSSEPNSPSHMPAPESPKLSDSCTLDVRSLDASHSHQESDCSELAYDNLGFVSDLHA